MSCIVCDKVRHWWNRWRFVWVTNTRSHVVCAGRCSHIFAAAVSFNMADVYMDSKELM